MRLLLSLLCLALTAVNADYFDVATCSPTTPCIFVSPSGDDSQTGTIASPVRTVQKALNLVPAQAPPTNIVLQDGTYPGGIVWKGSSITLTSVHGSAFTFIDCNHTPEQHGIWIGSGESPTTVISGVTIQNCNATMGAGMAIVGPNTKPVLRNVVLRQNQATMGAGIFVLFASPSLFNVETNFNRGRDGAGIYVIHNGTVIPHIQYEQLAMELNYIIPPGPVPNGANAVLSISDHRATGNRVVEVGAVIFAQGATIVITRSIFQSNQAGGSGVMGLGAGSRLTLTDSSFISNKANTMFGGAIAVRQGSHAVIQRCTFTGNSAFRAGGAIAVGEPLSTINVDSCNFNNNQAKIGSIIAFDPNPRIGSTITNSNANGNIASEYGGIFFNNVPTAQNVNLGTNTFSNNSAPFGADYGSLAASVGFVDPNQSQLGDSTHSPSVLPAGFTTVLFRNIAALQPIPLRVVIVDVFGQRITAPGVVNYAFVDSVPVTPGASPALLAMSSSRIELDDGYGDTSVIIIGDSASTYTLRVSTQHPLIPSATVNVNIKPCFNPFSPKCNNCFGWN